MTSDAIRQSANAPPLARGRIMAAPLLPGAAVLYLPTYWGLASTIWQTEDGAHGPIVLAVSAWLLWKALARLPIERPAGAEGWFILVVGLALYVIGRSQDVLLFEVGSQIPVISAAIALTFGWGAVRTLAFPIFFLTFMVPLPGGLIDALTAPLKLFVSQIAEQTLYTLGFPVARQGVVLQVGQYQLLVADACSGLNSIFSLAALGVLYLHLVRHRQRWRNIILLLSIVPLAVAANAIRVIALIVITYFLGEEAGQGFLHGFAGITLFLVALLLLLGLDLLLSTVARNRGR